MSQLAENKGTRLLLVFINFSRKKIISLLLLLLCRTHEVEHGRQEQHPKAHFRMNYHFYQRIFDIVSVKIQRLQPKFLNFFLNSFEVVPDTRYYSEQALIFCPCPDQIKKVFLNLRRDCSGCNCIYQRKIVSSVISYQSLLVQVFGGTFTISKVKSERGGFQLMQILRLLGMYFDAAVVKVKTFLLLFRLALAIL